VKPPRPGWPQEPPGGPGCPPEPPGPGWPPAPPGHGPGWPRPPAGDLPKTFEDVTGLDYKADRPELKATFEAFDGSVTGRKDGRVGPAEFAKVAPLIAMEGSDYGHFRDKGARTPDDFARALIREGDRDGDGQLSRSEFEALSRAVGPKKSGWE
jgi:hypothetical protein